MKVYMALEQFEVHVLLPIRLWREIDVSFTNMSLYLMLVLLSGVVFLGVGVNKMRVIPSRWQILIESIYKFVVETVVDQAGMRGLAHFPILFVTFMFILLSNLLGMMPFGYTPSAHIVITFLLALSFNLGYVVLGIVKNGGKFFMLFVPSGVPIVLMPLVMLIEVISYLLRTFSLSIRLFANMLAGHTMLHILATSIVVCGKSKVWFMIFIPGLIVMALIVLEFVVAFLQAYVFFILLCIYLNDSLNPGH